jgi:hypothetical protein
MAIGTKTDFKIYHDEFYGGMVEKIDQMINAFGAASNNAIRVVNERSRGDYQKDSFIKDISALVSRRDITSVAAATDTALTADELISVKLNRKIGPVAQTLDAWKKIGQDASEMSFVLGQMTAERKLKDYLNTALAALVAGIGNVSGLVNDYAATGTNKTLDTAQLVVGLSKMGDMSGQIVAWVTHSKSYFDLVTSQISANIFEVAGFAVRTGTPLTMNRPVIVTDAPALVVSGAPNTYMTLGLVENAAVIMESEQSELVSEIVTGLENLVMRIQGEFAYNLGLKGFKWDVANGGANPADAAVATGTNWDKAVTSDKALAGILIKAD